jgi:hypothetical protein
MSPVISSHWLAVVREQRDGASLLDAFRRHTRGFWERFAETVSGGGETHRFWEIVRASSALRDYGEASFGRQAQRVGECGLERVTCGEDPAIVVSYLLVRADEAYDLLARGLAEYTPLRA